MNKTTTYQKPALTWSLSSSVQLSVLLSFSVLSPQPYEPSPSTYRPGPILLQHNQKWVHPGYVVRLEKLNSYEYMTNKVSLWSRSLCYFTVILFFCESNKKNVYVPKCFMKLYVFCL